MQRHDLLHELDVLHQPHHVVGEELNGGHRPHATRVKRGRMDVASLHQAEHLPRQSAHLQRLEVERPLERVQRAHDVGDGLEAVQLRVRRLGALGLVEHARVGLLDHLLAEVHAHQVVLEDVVVEHVLGGFAQVDDPLGHGRRLDAERHVLRVGGARRVVVAADAANAAGDEMRVARVFPLHEDAVAAKDRRGAVTLRHLARAEVDFREDAQAADDAGDRIPVHLDEVGAAAGSRGFLDVWWSWGSSMVTPVFPESRIPNPCLQDRGEYPVVSSARECRHFGSLLSVACVKLRSAVIARP